MTLDSYNISIILPVFGKFNKSFFFQTSKLIGDENGFELLVLFDDANSKDYLLKQCKKNKFVNWRVIYIPNTPNTNLAKRINTGIKLASKKHILVVNYLLLLEPEAIKLMAFFAKYYDKYYISLNVNLQNHSSNNKNNTNEIEYLQMFIPYGGTIVNKDSIFEINGYDESIQNENILEKNLRERLKIIGVNEFRIPQYDLQYKVSIESFSYINEIEKIYPYKIKSNLDGWGCKFYEVLYDWESKKLYNIEQCLEYLKEEIFIDFEINSYENIFNKKYELLILLPVYNETRNIIAVLNNIENFCCGIILLDDNSTDDTFKMAKSHKIILKVKKNRSFFNDRQNRNILLKLASFFYSRWHMFIDADERFSTTFFDLDKLLHIKEDIIGVWIANLWGDIDHYRVNMKDNNKNSQNGLWFRWRIFRNIGYMQILSNSTLHFSPIPYRSSMYISRTLLLHFGYLTDDNRINKYNFYINEDKSNLLDYSEILDSNVILKKITLISENDFYLSNKQ